MKHGALPIEEVDAEGEAATLPAKGRLLLPYLHSVPRLISANVHLLICQIGVEYGEKEVLMMCFEHGIQHIRWHGLDSDKMAL